MDVRARCAYQYKRLCFFKKTPSQRPCAQTSFPEGLAYSVKENSALFGKNTETLHGVYGTRGRGVRRLHARLHLPLPTMVREDPLLIRPFATALGLNEQLVAIVASLGLTGLISAGLLACTLSLRVAYAQIAPPLSASSAPALQPVWDWLVKRDTALSTLVRTPFFPGLLSALYYFAACSPWVLLQLLGARTGDKFQAKAQQGPRDWGPVLLLTLKHHLLFVVPGLLANWHSRGPWFATSHGGVCWEDCDGEVLLPDAAPALLEVGIHVGVCFVVFDASYGLWHALHHVSPPLYRHVHSMHHEYRAPFSFVTQYETLVEMAPVSMWSMMVPMGLGCHPLTTWIWLLAVIQASVDAHSGFNLGLGPLLRRMLPAWGGPEYHDNHHRLPRSNFQPFFNWFDLAFGTTYDQQVALAATKTVAADAADLRTANERAAAAAALTSDAFSSCVIPDVSCVGVRPVTRRSPRRRRA
jgi:sterol desaturase/sphingolipid hydroxylase (fatty acid hydroxylase superfamily)